MKDNAPAAKRQVPDLSEKLAWLKRVHLDPAVSTTAKTIAASLMMFHNQRNGRCDPSQTTIADAVALSRKSVVAGIEDLRVRGWITTIGGQGQRLNYRLEVDHEQAESAERPSKRTPPARPNLSPLRDNHLSTLRDNTCRPHGTGGVTRMGQGVSPVRDTELSKGTVPRTNQENSLGELQAAAPPAPPVSGSDDPDAIFRAASSKAKQAAPPAAAANDDLPHSGQTEPEYAFEAGVIKLNDRDFRQWKDAYPTINVPGELYAMADWAEKLEAEGESWRSVLPRQLNKLERAARVQHDKARLQAEAEAKIGLRHATRSSRPAI